MCAYDNLALCTYLGIFFKKKAYMYADVHLLFFVVVVHFHFHICLVYTHCSRAKEKKKGREEGARIAPIPCSHPFSRL